LNFWTTPSFLRTTPSCKPVSLEDLLPLLPNAIQAPFNSYDKRHDPLCLPDTRSDVLQQITSWADGQDGRCIFWLNGFAGTGKSTIARTIARKYYEKKRLGASFFFSRGNGDVGHAGKFFASIASQLAYQSEALKGYICKAIDKCRDIASKGLHDQWTQLIIQPLSMLEANAFPSPFLIVVDALDECEGDNDIRAILQLLVELNGRETTRLYIFITSRPEIPIRLGFRAMPEILHHDLVLQDVPRAIVDQDISVFFRVKFMEITDEFEGLAANWPGDEKINLLVQRAEGLFIYAATVCRFVKGDGQWPPQDLLHLFIPTNGSDRHHNWEHDIPSASPTWELDEVYTQVLQHSLKDIKDDRDKQRLTEMSRQVIGSISILPEPLSAATLAKLLDVREEMINLRLSHLHSVLNISKDQEAPIRLLHPSFREFLLDRQRCHDESFWVDEKERHKALAQCCVRLMSCKLKRNICGLHAPDSRAQELDSGRLKQCIPPELQYACRYWVDHLWRSESRLYDNGQVHVFIQENLLHWLEALSLMGNMSEGAIIVRNLESILTVSNGFYHAALLPANMAKYKPDANSLLLAIIQDANRFVLRFGSIIEKAPLQTYCAALAFSPRESEIVRQFWNQRCPRIKRVLHAEETWSPSRGTLEGHSGSVTSVAFSPNGQLVASCSGGWTVRLWDAATGAARGTLKGHSGNAISVAFSPNDQLVASGSYDWTVRLWDAATGAARGTLELNVAIKNLFFSASGQYLETDRGVLEISSLLPKLSFSFSHCLRTLFVSSNWVAEKNENILWLPPDYRATCIAVWNGVVVLGHLSGGISFLEFE